MGWNSLLGMTEELPMEHVGRLFTNWYFIT